ncbi:MAG: DUF2341 domain-containing protein [Candidatus Komeilibacteria bacterium]
MVRIIKKIKNIDWKYGATIFSVAVIIVVGIIYIFNKPEKVKAEWYNDGWAYRQTIAISNSGSAQTDVQVKILSGVDLSALITAGKLQSDLDDLRFTDINGNVLRYWIEDSTTTSIDLWGVIDYVPSSGTTVYMYYGNPTASAYSNAASVKQAGGTLSTVSGYRIHTFTGDGTFSTGENITAEVLVVAGGGGGGARHAGGGGGGGVLHSASSSIVSGTHIVTVGDGGAGTINVYPDFTASGEVGGNSVFGSLIAIGGGGGGSWNSGQLGTVGGSGGGNITTAQIAGTAGQGYAGGGSNTNASPYNHGGGGGAGAVGQNGQATKPGDGGNGVAYDISGVSTYYGGGGGGGSHTPHGTTSSGGLGGGGNEGTNDGTANTGGGGGGGTMSGGGESGGNGGSGIVIIKYPAVTTISAVTPQSEEAGPGPVGHWKFDEGYGTNTKDATSNSNDGTISGATWQTEDKCISGKCLYFDGSSSNVNNGAGPKPTSAITMMAWVKPTAVDGAYHNVIDHHEGYEFQERGDSNWRTYINLSTSGWSNAICTSITVEPNKWYFVSGTYDSATGIIKTYVDGSLCSSTSGFTGQTIAYGGTNTTSIGALNNAAGRFFEGFIDEVKIYDYARSDAQIKADYLAGQAGSASGVGASFGGGQQRGDSEGLVGYWAFDETSSPAVDSSGNGNNGTWSGTANDAVGKYGNSISFDGDSDYVALPTDATLSSVNDFTIETWFYLTDYNSNGRTYILDTRGNGATAKGVGLVIDGTSSANTNISHFLSYNTTGYTEYDTDYTVESGRWYHTAFVRSGTELAVYMDGLAIAYSQTGGSIDPNSDPITFANAKRVGTYSSAGVGGNYWMNGRVDDLKFYTVARTADQIMRDYKTGPTPLIYWNFDEGQDNTCGTADLCDRSGHGFNALNYNSPEWVLGKYGGALEYDGATTYSAKSFSPSITGSQPFTIMAWAKSPGADSDKERIIADYAVTFLNWNVNNTISFMRDGTSYFTTTSPETFSTNTWHHVVGIYDGNEAILYVNGIERNRITVGVGDRDFGTLQVAKDNSDWTDYYHGAVDEVKVYNYARTPEQILWDMYGDESVHPMVDLPFNEGYGSTTKNIGYMGIDSTLCNSPSWTVDGKYSKALDFDGTNDYTTLSSSTLFDYTGEDKTFSFWMKADTGETTGYVLSKPWNGSGEYNYSFHWYGSGLTFRLDGTGGQQSINTTTTMTTDNWYHVAMTLDSQSKMRTFYINGEKDNSGVHTISAWTPDSGDANHTLNVGTLYNYNCSSWAGNASHAFDGKIDDVKIYNFKLSPEQVRQEYTRGAQVSLGQQKTSSEAWDAGGFGGAAPIAYWNFEDSNQTTYLYDKAGTNNGTLVGSMTSDDWVLGKIGSGLNINNSQGALLSSTINLADTSNWTISSWVKSNSAGDETVISNSSGGPVTSDIGMKDGKIWYRHYYSNAWHDTYGTSAINDNQWHFLTWVNYSNQTIDLYVDGVLENDGAVSTESSNGPVNQIGRNWGTAANITIDEVKYFNYARSQAQIAFDYNGGKPIGWWRFNDGEGIVARDNSGNGDNGTLTLMDPATDWLDAISCKFEGCLDLDGTDDKVEMSGTGNNYEVGDHTFTVWTKSTGTRDGNKYIMGHYNWRFRWASDTSVSFVVGRMNDAAGPIYTITKDVGARKTEWMHLAGVYKPSASRIYFYVNGEYVYEQNIGADIIYTDYGNVNLRFGWSSHGGATYYQGLIDDARIYNYALTADQIKKVMNYGSVYIK